MSAPKTTKKKTAKAPAKKKAAPVKAAKSPRHAALEATGLAEQLLEGRGIAADVGVEMKGKAFYAVIRVRVEELPALLGNADG